jgi:hypothetical protein
MTPKIKYVLVDDGPMTEREKLAASLHRYERAKQLAHSAKVSFRREGATTVATVPADACAIVGHKWLPERLHTKWCRVCKLWEAL